MVEDGRLICYTFSHVDKKNLSAEKTKEEEYSWIHGTDVNFRG